MTIKKFAFAVQARLREAHAIELKRSHAHEVIAALFGFKSYAALSRQQVLAQYEGWAPDAPLDIAAAAARALDLGYAPPTPPTIAVETARLAEAERLCVVTVDEVLGALGVESDSGDPIDDTTDEGAGPSFDLDSPILRESLGRMADAGVASAHLALAQLDDWQFGHEPEGAGGGGYWFEQQQSGRVLAGVELEWAEGYRRRLEACTSREEHLRRAAALGSAEAALLQAEESPGDETFHLAARLAGARQASRLGELALSSGREADARKWLRVAAKQGDTDAMKTLASELESDLKDAWTWVHLADLLGVDVMAYHAAGDDDLPADADEAGPLYPAGGFDLEQLAAADDAIARDRARMLFEAIGT